MINGYLYHIEARILFIARIIFTLLIYYEEFCLFVSANFFVNYENP